MALPNQERVGRAMDLLRAGLARCVEQSESLMRDNLLELRRTAGDRNPLTLFHLGALA